MDGSKPHILNEGTVRHCLTTEDSTTWWQSLQRHFLL